MKTKKCPKCGIEKPLTAEFYNRDKRNRSGFKSHCKACLKESNAEHYQNNKEKFKEYRAERYQNNKEKFKESRAEYRKKLVDEQPACVYQILNKINGKFYIGETTRGELRWKDHLTALRGNYHGNPKLQEDFNEFGEEAFEWSIIKEIDKDKDTLLMEEAKTIDSFLEQGKELYNKYVKLLQEDT